MKTVREMLCDRSAPYCGSGSATMCSATMCSSHLAEGSLAESRIRLTHAIPLWGVTQVEAGSQPPRGEHNKQEPHSSAHFSYVKPYSELTSPSPSPSPSPSTHSMTCCTIVHGCVMHVSFLCAQCLRSMCLVTVMQHDWVHVRPAAYQWHAVGITSTVVISTSRLFRLGHPLATASNRERTELS